MTHRIIISRVVRDALTDEEVRAEMSPSQCTAVDDILGSCPDPVSNAQMLQLLYRLAAIYVQDD